MRPHIIFADRTSRILTSLTVQHRRRHIDGDEKISATRRRLFVAATISFAAGRRSCPTTAGHIYSTRGPKNMTIFSYCSQKPRSICITSEMAYKYMNERTNEEISRPIYIFFVNRNPAF